MSEPNIYDNYNEQQIIETIIELKEQKDATTKEIKFAENVLIERKHDDINLALSKKDEPFGAVSEKIAGQKVTFTTPKKVSWNQGGLAANYKQMILDGADPSEYIQAEFKIKEEAYKNWPSDIKAFFEPHRTVESGPIAIKIEAIKEK